MSDKKAKIVSPATLLNKVLRSGQLKYCLRISAVSIHSISMCFTVRGQAQGMHSGESSFNN